MRAIISLTGLFLALFYVAINVAVIYGALCLGGSAIKVATEKCSTTWKIDRYVTTDLFCEE